MKSLNKKNQGVSLVAAVAIMVLVAVLSAVLASLLGTSSRSSADFLRSARARGLAQAGLNWYMMQLAATIDWDTASDQAGVSLNPGTFDVTLSNKASPQTDSTTATRMDIAVTGKVAGSEGATIQRTMSQRVFKLPSATKFALFWGNNLGANLTFTNVSINGDFWSIGTTSIPASSSVTNGIAYRPTTEDIIGAGSYTTQSITFPYFFNFSGSTATFSTPPINTTFYTNLISDYDTKEAACTTLTDIFQTTDLVLTGNTVCCQDFDTNGNITISGNGYIVANRDILLHTQLADAGTLTISPSGSKIVFIAGRDITVNSTGKDTSVTMNPGVRLYSKSDGIATGFVTIRNDTTNIDGALILAARRILINNSANIINSTLFVNDAGAATSNNLTVTDLGTSVGTLSGPCSLISLGHGSPSLQITSRASVTGLIYQRDGDATEAKEHAYGRINITSSSAVNRVNITGCIIANRFGGNNIDNANITYDPLAIPDPPPEGFDGFATKKPDSWNGN